MRGIRKRGMLWPDGQELLQRVRDKVVGKGRGMKCRKLAGWLGAVRCATNASTAQQEPSPSARAAGPTPQAAGRGADAGGREDTPWKVVNTWRGTMLRQIWWNEMKWVGFRGGAPALYGVGTPALALPPSAKALGRGGAAGWLAGKWGSHSPAGGTQEGHSGLRRREEGRDLNSDSWD